MQIGKFKIKAEISSNFPIPVIRDSVASRTRSKVVAQNISSISVAAGFLKKVAVIDREYPSIVEVKKDVIKVQISTVEIWAARASAILSLYLLARGYI